MKKTQMGLAGALAISALLTGCSSESTTPSTAASAGPEGLLKAGEFSVCMTPQYKPLEYYEDGDTSGQPVGFDADAAAAVAERWGVEVRFSDVAFDGLMPALQAGRCDAVWSGLYVNDERQEVADATPYLETGSVIIAPEGSDIESLDDLSGKTIAVLAGGAYAQDLENVSTALKEKGLPDLVQQAYPQNTQTTAAVINGKADALIDTDVSVGEIVEKTGGKLQVVPGIFDANAVFGVYTSKGSPLGETIGEALLILQEDGTLGEIATTYGLDPTRLAAGAA